jgi:hypothetical protein
MAGSEYVTVTDLGTGAGSRDLRCTPDITDSIVISILPRGILRAVPGTLRLDLAVVWYFASKKNVNLDFAELIEQAPRPENI